MNNLSECEKEQIHLIGSIQSHGFTFVLDDSGLIKGVSENTFRFLGKNFKSLINQNINYHLDKLMFNDIRKNINQTFSLKINDYEEVSQKFESYLSYNNEFYILDCVNEPDHYQNLSYRPIIFNDLNDIQNELERVRSKIGWNRVFLYQFDRLSNGKVILESKDFEENSFLDHWFPASDIPRQARELYIKNKVRFISNIDKEPANLFMIDANNKTLDLTNSRLRAISPIHIEYLSNMKVKCSLSASLVRESKLIGLIAAHNLDQIDMSFKQMEYFLAFSKEVEKYLNKEYEKRIHDLMICLKNFLDNYGDEKTKESVKSKFKLDFIEITPLNKDDDYTDLFENDNFLIAENIYDQPFQIRKDDYPGLISFIYGQKIYHFRRLEYKSEKLWGGLPQSKVPYRGGRIEPRKSFESYIESTKGTCYPWSQEIVDVIRQLV